MQTPAKTRHQKLHNLEEGRCRTSVVRDVCEVGVCDVGVCDVGVCEVTARRLTLFR